jgi:hypothetical protein
MQRLENLSAITSIALLVGGILITHFAPNLAWSIHWRGTGYGFSWQMLCNGLAVLFSVFACLYSVNYIPFDKALLQWHFWLSLCSVVFCAVEWTIFSILAERNTLPSQLSVLGITVVLSFFLSVLVFVSAQLLFAVNVTRALLKMHLA